MKKIAIALMLLSTSCYAQDWKPNPKFVAKEKEKIESVQCSGTKKNGERCKIKGKNDSTNPKYKHYLCRFHKNQE